jgi:ribonuclease J
VDWNGKLMVKPEIHLRGVVTSIERPLLQKWVQQRIEEILSVRWKEFVINLEAEKLQVDWGGVQGVLERELARSIRRELQCQPSLTLLLQVPEEPPAKAAAATETATATATAAAANDGRRRRPRTAAVAS